VQEFWFCADCKSMNRANAKQCYHCHAARTQENTLATAVLSQSRAVLTPGLDDEHRELAWELMRRSSYFSAWALGYVAAGLLAITAVAVAALLAADFVFMLAHQLPDPIPGDDPRAGWVGIVAATMGLLFLATVIVHSAFLAVTSLNTAALGSGSPRFGPERAAVWWIESLLWAIRAALAFVGPPLLFLLAVSIGGLLIGVIGGIIWFVCCLVLLGDPISSLGKPSRLLRDLHERLAVPGSSDSRVVTMWAAAWGTARGLDYAVAGGTYLILIGAVALALIGVPILSDTGSGDQGRTAMAALAYTIVAIEFVADVIALFLLAQITADLAERQKTREKWVLGGGNGVAAVPTPPSPRPAGTAQAGPPPIAAQPAPLRPSSVSSTAPAPEPQLDPDRLVIQPSSVSVARYRAPGPGEPLPGAKRVDE
jgi:hypothetical protein